MLSRFYDPERYWIEADEQICAWLKQARNPELITEELYAFQDSLETGNALGALNYIQAYGLLPLPIFLTVSPLQYLQRRIRDCQGSLTRLTQEEWRTRQRIEKQLRDYEFLLYVLTEYTQGTATLDELKEAAKLRHKLEGVL